MLASTGVRAAKYWRKGDGEHGDVLGMTECAFHRFYPGTGTAAASARAGTFARVLDVDPP